jgi:hypothetical protein
LEDNLAALAVSLTDEDTKRIDAINPPGEKIVHYHRADMHARARWL